MGRAGAAAEACGGSLAELVGPEAELSGSSGHAGTPMQCPLEPISQVCEPQAEGPQGERKNRRRARRCRLPRIFMSYRREDDA